MRNFTKKETEELSDLAFTKLVLQGLLDRRSNQETPTAQKLRSAISTVSLLDYKAKQEKKGLSKERAIEIMQGYINNDLEAADPGYVREVLQSLCTDDEIKQLGFGWAIEGGTI